MVRTIIRVAGAIGLALACAPDLDGATEPPTLLIDARGLTELKRRIVEVPAARREWTALVRRVDAALREPVVLPPRGANWYHWYVCPTHGNRLKTGKRLGDWRWEHTCPTDGKVIPSDPKTPQTDFDGCALASVHGGYASQARDAGLAYRVTGNRKYAARAREILLAYARKYAEYPLHTIRGEAKVGGGRVGSQTLDESTWLIPVAQATDLVLPELSRDDRLLLADRLLRPAARDVILPHKLGVHNIQCWKNSAVGLVGFLLNDRALIAAAIDDPDRGYRRQMAEGVNADGQWWEGAWGYHFYTISAVLPLVEAARHKGIDLYGPKLKRLFDGPIALAMPDLVLPNFNDSAAVNLASEADLYELAYARYRDPKYLPLLARSKRTGLNPLLYGVEPLPAASTDPTAPRGGNYPAAGYAMLAGGPAADPTWLCLKYGPHGGGHGHPDKLNLVVYAHGRPLAIDPGITSYGAATHQGWYRTTIAHNTLTIDGRNQREAQGKVLGFGDAGGIPFAVADAGPIADGVRFVRGVALVDPRLIVVVDLVRSDREHTYDLAYHQRGQWAADPSGATPWNPPDDPGYRYLRDAATAKTEGPFAASIRVDDRRATGLTLAAGGPTEVLTATGIGSSTADRVPTAIFRRHARATAYVWAVSLDDRPVKLETLPVADANGTAIPAGRAAAVRVEVDGRERLLLVNPDGLKLRVAAPGGAWTASDVFATK